MSSDLNGVAMSNDTLVGLDQKHGLVKIQSRSLMKKRLTFLVAALLVAQASIACFEPRSGAEYDRLIQIESTDKKNEYRVAIPNKSGVRSCFAMSSDLIGIAIKNGVRFTYPIEAHLFGRVIRNKLRRQSLR